MFSWLNSFFRNSCTDDSHKDKKGGKEREKKERKRRTLSDELEIIRQRKSKGRTHGKGSETQGVLQKFLESLRPGVSLLGLLGWLLCRWLGPGPSLPRLDGLLHARMAVGLMLVMMGLVVMMQLLDQRSHLENG